MVDSLKNSPDAGQYVNNPAAQPVQDTSFRFEDSLPESPGVKSSHPQINLYQSHELKVRHDTAKAITHDNPNWVFPILLISFCLFTFLKVFYSRYFNKLFQSVTNRNLSNQFIREENILAQGASILLNVIFYLSASLILYFISTFYHWEIIGLDYGFSRFFFFTVLVAAVFTLKLLILKGCGYIFGLDKEASIYIFNVILTNNALGILLLPVAALYAFAAIATTLIIKVSISIFIVAFIFRFTRGILTAVSSPNYSTFYLILYLCALELAPLAVLLKIISFE